MPGAGAVHLISGAQWLILRDEAPPGVSPEANLRFDVLELPAAAQQRRLFQTRLQMAVAAFDGAVLMRDTAIVASGLHAVIIAQRLVARAQILTRVAIQVGEW